MKQDQQRFAQTRQRLEQVEMRIQALSANSNPLREPLEAQKAQIDAMLEVHEELVLLLRRLSSIQISVRVELIPLPPFAYDPQEAVRTALRERLDLMNRRAQVMDGRRQLEIAADQLESTMDVVVEGAVSTPPIDGNRNPLDFRARDSEFRVGMAFKTPLDRRVERNAYRATQIAYQRARRNLSASEDQIKLDVRQEVRTLAELTARIEIIRRAVRSAARELDFAQSEGEGTQRGLSLSRALRNLRLNANALTQDWLDYETTRLNLHRDLGTLEVNEQGLWSDPFYQRMIERSQSQPNGETLPEGEADEPEVLERLPPA